MDHIKIKTLGQLKETTYTSKSIKTELRDNLIANLKTKKKSFPAIHGYEDTVIPELERAILSKHNINLLGLRGQAKTRLARLMIHLLDEWIPVVSGSEINDDPFNPISKYALDLIAKVGDKTPIDWLHREQRFSEKLATPDVSIADLIGDIDPIKAANLKLSYSDPGVLHFGMIPRAHRCIFVINELPDLQARIQVALFNILQEGDIQIRGFNLRLPLDIQFVFTANPEDYTNRGSIVTPLKDRIGSQILTHYPKNLVTAKAITAQEITTNLSQNKEIHVPDLAKDILEQISFEARKSEFIDNKSGISARLSIAAYESLISTAERRMLLNDESHTAIRVSDFMGIIPAITGKVELVYEGEQEGAENVALTLIDESLKTLIANYFPTIEKLEKESDEKPYQEIIEWFFEESGFKILDNSPEETYTATLNAIPALNRLLAKYQPDLASTDTLFMKEFVLWALVANKKLNKSRLLEGYQFNDLYGSYINGL